MRIPITAQMSSISFNGIAGIYIIYWRLPQLFFIFGNL